MLESAQAFAKRAQEEVRGDVPDIDLAVFRAMFGLSRATSRLVADFESVVQRPHGVSWSGFRLLFCLQVSGPLQTRELARLLFTTPPTVSSVVNTLERRGWVRRERLDRDRRLVQMHLTPAGRRLVAEVSQAQHERERSWVEDVDRDDLAAFVRVTEHLATRSRPEPGQAGRAAQSGQAGQAGRAGQSGHVGQGGQAGQSGRAGQGGQVGQVGQVGRGQAE